jgi:hypothetical protein
LAPARIAANITDSTTDLMVISGSVTEAGTNGEETDGTIG